MVVTENGTRLEEGTILRNVQVRRSDRNLDDGIAWVDKFAIIVKGAGVSAGGVLVVDLKLDRVKDRFAFASMV